MTVNSEDLINSILASLDRVKFISVDDIPNIELYMDQVTTFMDERLKSTARYPGEDKILTKTMINNYAKNDLLPPPVRKKYSKEHVLLLIFIYYFKGILSINDIQTLLGPITDKFFQKKGDFGLEDIYREAAAMGTEQIENMKSDLKEYYNQAGEAFPDAPEEEKEFLTKFAFICHLSFDVYVKKLIIEKLVDEISGAKKSSDSGKKE